ncbi:MAG: DUF3048 domain-containing protein [Actinobacteria bacterium]|nr:DUF3048 domain-containing protein [Actinomycetota bacterium]NBO47453.1 DUF3048 domain-containing protein [Actinomycetota bacterium]NDG68599.1 DUF3048 domain-containing protein [Actinomycetota bacterium]
MRRILALPLLALFFASCAALPLAEKKVEIERNLYTNLPGSSGKVFAVKFDDTNYAHPQQGVEAADIVYITQVEAGLTRLMGIYSSNYPEVLGPIRSARISDISVLGEYGKVGFLYSGAQSKMRPVISAANLVNLSAERNPPSIYFNDPDRNSPYSMMVKPNLLLEKARDVEMAKEPGWQHGEKAETAEKILSAQISWPNAKYEAYWSASEKRFLLKHNGRENISTSGVQLGSNMMVIQIVKISPSEYGDKFGGVTPKSEVIGSGHGYLLRNQRVVKALWNRASLSEPTTWSLGDGSPAYFAPGQIWFFLTDSEPKFTYVAKSSK